MLEKAKDLGIVEINIKAPRGIDPQLSTELKNAFGLTRAIAVSVPNGNTQVLRDAIGRVAASLMPEVLRPGDVIGVASGRTTEAMTRFLGPLPRCDIVSLCGVARASEPYSMNVIRRFGEWTGGQVWPIFAPFVVADPKTAIALGHDPDIAAAMHQHSRVSVGVVVVGSWDPPDSQFYETVAGFGMADALVAEGAAAEVCATLIDADGAIITSLDDHTVGISAEQLRQIPEVIAIAGGPTKHRAIRATLRSGLVHSLVTDTQTARALLSA
jgi:DNA-binding transcriptional regulator LsrR (DeoR family)